MFELDESLTHIETTPERVVSVITSLNTPDVMTNLPKPEPTQAFICAIQGAGRFEMYIYFYHQKSQVARIYPWTGDPVTRESFAEVEAAALEFTESMGLLMDNAHYRKKSAEEREEFFNSLPLFHADLSAYASKIEEQANVTLPDLSEDLEELDLDDATPDEASAEALEVVDLESSDEEPLAATDGAPAAGDLEVMSLDPEAGESPEDIADLDEIEVAPADESGAEDLSTEVLEIPEGDAPSGEDIPVDENDPFGELVVESEPASAPPVDPVVSPEGMDAALKEINEPGAGADEPPLGGPDLFATQEGETSGDLNQDLDASIDALISSEDETAAVPASAPVEPAAVAAPAPAPEEDSLDGPSDDAPSSEVVGASEPEPKAPVAASPPVTSLEEEILTEPEPDPEPDQGALANEPPAPAQPADPEELRQRLERIGRLLASW